MVCTVLAMWYFTQDDVVTYSTWLLNFTDESYTRFYLKAVITLMAVVTYVASGVEVED